MGLGPRGGSRSALLKARRVFPAGARGGAVAGDPTAPSQACRARRPDVAYQGHMVVLATRERSGRARAGCATLIRNPSMDWSADWAT